VPTKLNDVVDLIHEMNQAFKRWVVRQSACGESEPSMPCGDSPAKHEDRQVTVGLARVCPKELCSRRTKSVEGPLVENS